MTPLVDNTIELLSYNEIGDCDLLEKSPLISVHMLVYNHEPFIARAIESVVSQETDFSFELVIGEDRSSDNSFHIIEKYQQKYPNLIRIVYSEENVGINNNFVRVLNACRGTFTAICEGDDYWIDSKKLQIQTESLLIDEGIDLSCHPCVTLDEGQGRVSIGGFHRVTSGVIPLEKVIQGGGAYLPSGSLFFRTSAVRDARIWRISPPVSDYFTQIYGARRGGVLFVNRPMSVYRRSHGGAWTTDIRKGNKLLEFDMQFARAIVSSEQDFPKNERDFNYLMLWTYMSRGAEAKQSGNQLLSDHSIAVLRNRISGSGLWYRFLFGLSQSTAGSKLVKWADRCRGICDRFAQKSRALLCSFGSGTPKI